MRLKVWIIDLKKVKTTPCRVAEEEEEDVVRRVRGTGDSLSGVASRRISLRNDVLIPLLTGAAYSAPGRSSYYSAPGRSSYYSAPGRSSYSAPVSNYYSAPAELLGAPPQLAWLFWET